MEIPILNIYYLLCYAWDKLEERDKVNTGISDYTQVEDLLGRVLNNGCNHLFKRGLDRDYLAKVEEYSGVKGKINFTKSLKDNSFRRGKAVCEFDSFEHNILQNQLIKATVLRLTKIPKLDGRLKKELWNTYWRFTDVDEIEVRISQFNQVRIHRNNSFYDFLLRVCRLIVDFTALNENGNAYVFKDFSRDDRALAALFEAFVRNFYKKSQQEFNVSSTKIDWKAEPLYGSDTSLLPEMRTDITLESPGRKIIIDTKYYTETTSTYHGAERFHSHNLYQVFSYLTNLPDNEVNRKAEGMLLYPTVKHDYDQTYRLGNNNIRLVTVDLAKSWKEIDIQLREVIKPRE